MIYFDNAATSWPKPEAVYTAMDKAARESCGNPGRSGHKLSQAAGRLVEEARLACAGLLRLPKPERLIFTLNATDAINLALFGFLRAGDHVITDSMGHNSLTRPLAALEKLGVSVTKVPGDPVNGVDPDAVRRAWRRNTRLLACTHISNVTGTVNPLEVLAGIARSAGTPLLVDAAQSAGCHTLDVQTLQIDLLAFPGHKGLFGPQGTGGLYVKEGLELVPRRFGGTGSFSGQLEQPAVLPDRYESGTVNTPGLAGLAAGVAYLSEVGLDNVQSQTALLTNRLLDGLAQIKEVRVYGPPPSPERAGVVSFRVGDMLPHDVAAILDNSFDIAVRAGLHCAPDAHRTIGLLDRGGTVRASIGYLNTAAEIDRLLEAVAAIAAER